MMMKHFNKFFFAALAVIGLAGCDDEFDHDLVRDNQPEIPVMFEGAITEGANPYYTVQAGISTGTAAELAAARLAEVISITLTIPEESSKKITEITKVVGGATGVTPGNLTTATPVSYLGAGVTIPVNGTKVTFTTTVSEFNSKVAAAARLNGNGVATIPANVPYVERAFMFLLTMDDGTTIIPQQVRIRYTR